MTPGKVEKFKCKAWKLLQEKVVIVRELASFIGSIINAFFCCFRSSSALQGFGKEQDLGLQGSTYFDKKVALSEASVRELF